MNKTIPKWLQERACMNSRQWRQHKRQQLKTIIKAVSEYHTGCAYTPSYSDTEELDTLLRKMEKANSVKEWGN